MRRNRARGERGVSLIEVMVALSILSTVLLSLTGLMWQMGRHSRTSGAVTQRTAALESASSQALSLSWDSLPQIVGCQADTTAQLAYTLCFEVQTLTTQLREVRVIVSPTNPATLLADTITVHRTKPRRLSPLNTQ